MIFAGKFARQIDEKQRVALPKPLRSALEENATKGLYVAPGTDGSLALYTEEGLAKLAERLAGASPAGKDVRAFSRLFYAQVQLVEIDAQGRIRIPQELATLAGLGREGVLIGVLDHWELWEPSRWEAYSKEKQSHFDDIAEAAFRVE
jgi:MraZ protein